MLSLLLIPGVMDTSRLYDHQVKHLSDVAQLVVADVTKQLSISEMAESVLAAAPPRFAVAGFSLGGYVALEMVRTAPSRIAKLALLGTSARPDTQERRERRMREIDQLKTMPFNRFMESHAPTYVHPSMAKDRSYLDLAVSMARELGPETFIRQNMAATNRPDALCNLDRINCPTIVIVGRQDKAMLVPSEELGKRISGARFVIIEDCGHYMQIERPQALTALLREWILYA
jgi:pimeloyl-ACP methyl ester carboxylesterase